MEIVERVSKLMSRVCSLRLLDILALLRQALASFRRTFICIDGLGSDIMRCISMPISESKVRNQSETFGALTSASCRVFVSGIINRGRTGRDKQTSEKT